MSAPAPAATPEPSAMPTMAVVFGITLIGLGLMAYLDPARFGSGKPVMSPEGAQVVGQNGLPLYEDPTPQAPTSLIPAGIGAIILLAGIASIAAPNARKHAMHAAAGAALLGALGGFVPINARNNDTYEAAVVTGYALVVISLGFLALCINSFVQARKSGTV